MTASRHKQDSRALDTASPHLCRVRPRSWSAGRPRCTGSRPPAPPCRSRFRLSTFFSTSCEGLEMVGVRAALETRNKSRDHRLFTDSALRITEEILQSEYCYSRPSLNTPRTPIQGPRKRVSGVYNGSAVFSDQFRIYPLGLNMAESWSIGYNWINIV